MTEKNNFGEKKEQAAGVIRLAAPADAEAIWRIRNNPSMRPNFHHQEEIKLEQHEKWFQDKYFKQQENRCFVLDMAGTAAGYCRFDLKEDGYLISIVLAPEYQNQGWGNKLLNEAMKALKTGMEIKAEVKKSNDKSARFFEKNGFEICGQDEEVLYYKHKTKK